MTPSPHRDPTEGSPLGRGPREEHAAEATSRAPSGGPRPTDATPAEDGRNARGIGATDATCRPTDPELEADLGAELEFRGEEMETELEVARREAVANLDAARRVQAEFDNYRKRVARDAEDAANRAGQRVISEILPALDNLERALQHLEAGGDIKALTDGVRMVLQQMLDVLAKEGVERIDPIGSPFDPNQHQAVAQAEDPSVPDGTVVQVYQNGYRMHGRVIRPPAVVVSHGGPARKE